MDTLVNGLLTIDRDNFKQRIVVVSGMGGLGKTQITLAFARANESWYMVDPVIVQVSFSIGFDISYLSTRRLLKVSKTAS